MRFQDRARGVCPQAIFIVLLAAGWWKPASPAQAEVWNSPLYEWTYVQVEKRLLDPLLDAEATAGLPPSAVFDKLPKDIEDQLGPEAVDYDSFAATYLPAEQAAELVDLARGRGFLASSGIDRSVHLPWRTWEPKGSEGRIADGLPPALLADRAVPGLFLVQFAYPLQEDWLESLEACGARRIADLQERTVLVRAFGPRTILACPVLRFVSWIDSYRNGDRISTELTKDAGDSEFLLQFVPGTDLGSKKSSLGEGLRPSSGGDSLEERMSMIATRGKLQDLIPWLANDPDLLSVSRRGVLALSDERQGQIVAGNHNGTAPNAPGYRAWLAARGLLTASNPQIVGIIDGGYDDGGAPTSTLNHHPDLESPERLAAPIWAWNNGTLYDAEGHGTMVAGIIAGEGATGFGTGATDPQGYLYGSGIAPNVKLVAARPGNKLELERLAPALDYCRIDPVTGVDRGLVVNNSYNGQKIVGGIFLADNEYDEFSMFFDDKVLDASAWTGLQSTTLVFSAGNFAYDYATGAIRKDSVASPATAKNVISVGATASYRPSPEPPLACFENPNGSRPPNQDALHIARLGLFSGRGRGFGSAPGPAMVHNVRVKPDLVAPGVRVFSTVPYFFSLYNSPVGCSQFYPLPNVNYYTYGTGTSFAAPVVTGVAALKRKWFLDRGTDPSPSLLKASLIATADSLGAFVGNDHRPSPNSGWGRVNLNRTTDARARFYVKDNQALAVSTGQQRSWTRTIDSPGSDTYIVLVWSDPKADVIGDSQAPLKNNLGLAVEQLGTTSSWRGNNFRENRVADDNGYSYRFTTLTETPFVDSINNVEAVFIPANTFAAGQKVILKVTGENVTAGAQKFAVYAYNVQLIQ